MSAESRLRAQRLRQWAGALTPLQRALFVVLARQVYLQVGGMERVDLQRRLDACRKVDKATPPAAP